jgi:hypothetical protein
MKICSRYDLQGWLFIYDKFGDWWDYQYVGQGNCSEVVHDLDEARLWRIGLLDPGGYELTLTPVEVWPQPSWGQVLDPFYDEQELHLEAVFKNTDRISGQPDQIRFWTSGYGFIGKSPLNSEMVLEWVPDPPLQFGTYGFRAQLMQGDTPATDVTPLNVELPVTCTNPSILSGALITSPFTVTVPTVRNVPGPLIVKAPFNA